MIEGKQPETENAKLKETNNEKKELEGKKKREIEFRGKRIIDPVKIIPYAIDGWVYGNYIDCGDEAYILPNDISKEMYIDEPYKFRANDFQARIMLAAVDPKSISQYTGLKDKNGKKIYEGDIIKSNHNRSFYKVYWEDYRFTIEDKWGNLIKPHQRAIDHFECEIVGNRWDNPELLEDRDD